MTKWTLYLIIVVFIVATVGCMKDNVINEKEQIEVEVTSEEEKDLLKVGFVEYPPYEYIENGKIKGIGIDMMREAFKRIGYSDESYEFVKYPWARLLEMTKTGSIHIILDASPTDERKEFLDFSEEAFGIYDINLVTLKNVEIPYQNNISDVQDLTIGVVRNYALGINYRTAVESDMLNLDKASTSDELLNRLIDERVDVIMDYKPVVLFKMRERGIVDSVKVWEPPIDINPTGIGYSKVHDLTDLRDKIDVAIRSMKDDGTLKSIEDKYLK